MVTVYDRDRDASIDRIFLESESGSAMASLTRCIREQKASVIECRTSNARTISSLSSHMLGVQVEYDKRIRYYTVHNKHS